MKLDWPPKVLAAMLALLATTALTLASSYSPAPPTRMAATAQANHLA